MRHSYKSVSDTTYLGLIFYIYILVRRVVRPDEVIVAAVAVVDLLLRPLAAFARRDLVGGGEKSPSVASSAVTTSESAFSVSPSSSSTYK